jgi:integrase
VIRRDGKRGPVWYVKYRDAGARQVKERLGPEPQWNRQRAERELGKRLDAVERGLRKHQRRTFNVLADEFDAVALAAKPRKTTTLIDYRATLRNHLRPAFGNCDLVRLSQQPEAFDSYAAAKLNAGLAPKTVRNHLALLGLMFRQARKWRWVAENPLELVDAPSAPGTEAETLAPSAIARLLAGYRELAANAQPADRHWVDSARRMTVVALSTGLRRGELLGLRWQDVDFLDRRVRVCQSFVRGEMTTPKSRAGRRALELGTHALDALEEQWKVSHFREPDSIVFCHEALGTPLDPSKLSKIAKQAISAAGIPDGFRPWHGLRHTALTETAAAGVPGMFVQAKAGHAQGSTTERYLHATKTAYPGAADLAEARLFRG